MHLRPSLSQDRLVEARQRLLESGDVSPELVSEVVARSWQRSRQAGLSPMELISGPPLVNASTLKAAVEQESEFLDHARPVMEFVFDQMRDSGSMVVLANAQGLLLHSLGDPEFLSRAERVSLRPGALWKEELRGTNAIGTALVEGQPVVVHGAEHYLERNGFLTCSAAPVRAPDGRLCGVIDISGDQRGYHPHTSALVRSASRMIEDKLFHARHTRDLLLRLHPRAEGLGAVGEGLIALSEDGWIMGANAIAQDWLGLTNTQIGSITLDRVLGPTPCGCRTCLAMARPPASRPCAATRCLCVTSPNAAGVCGPRGPRPSLAPTRMPACHCAPWCVAAMGWTPGFTCPPNVP